MITTLVEEYKLAEKILNERRKDVTRAQTVANNVRSRLVLEITYFIHTKSGLKIEIGDKIIKPTINKLWLYPNPEIKLIAIKPPSFVAIDDFIENYQNGKFDDKIIYEFAELNKIGRVIPDHTVHLAPSEVQGHYF